MAHSQEQVTPEWLFHHRRRFMKGAGALLAYPALAAAGLFGPEAPKKGEDTLTSYDDITTYNNYYEFAYNKQSVMYEARNYPMSPWKIAVEGLVEKPGALDLQELLTRFGSEKRVYRFRCVEGWSMVVPWHGFGLKELIEAVQPKPEAKFLRFTTDVNPKYMPNVTSSRYPWPYTEGLRLDEAMHPLTFLATGLYDKPLPAQNGGPVRLVVPWKYGFKSIKSIVRIEFLEEMPTSFWTKVVPSEYGFYANVNPGVSHPRWSQATERRLGEWGRRPTLKFNGYDEVASLYEGMDLEHWF